MLRKYHATAWQRWRLFTPIVDEQLQRYSSTYSSSWKSTRGQSVPDAIAIDFAIDEGEALKSFENQLRYRWLGPPNTGNISVTATWQPFWLFHANVRFLARGRVGYTQANIKHGWETATTWSYTPWVEFNAKLEPAEKEMQVYASLKHPKDLMAFSMGPFLNREKKMTPSMLRKGVVEPFELMKNMAWYQSREKIMRGHLAKKAKEAFQEIKNVSKVEDIDVNIISETVTSKKLYAPVYIISHFHEGWNFTATVNGFSGEALGDVVLSPQKSAMAAFLTSGAVFYLLFGVTSITSPFALIGQAIITATTALASTWVPRLMAKKRELEHERFKLEYISGGGSRGEYSFGNERVQQVVEDVFRRFVESATLGSRVVYRWETREEDATRRSAENDEEKRRREEFSRRYAREQQRRRSDPKGFYRTLGVPVSATADEIKASFRKLAMETHPDRQTASKREDAERRFKAISEAYQVLGNEEKRREYDG